MTGYWEKLQSAPTPPPHPVDVCHPRAAGPPHAHQRACTASVWVGDLDSCQHIYFIGIQIQSLRIQSRVSAGPQGSILARGWQGCSPTNIPKTAAHRLCQQQGSWVSPRGGGRACAGCRGVFTGLWGRPWGNCGRPSGTEPVPPNSHPFVL